MVGNGVEDFCSPNVVEIRLKSPLLLGLGAVETNSLTPVSLSSFILDKGGSLVCRTFLEARTPRTLTFH